MKRIIWAILIWPTLLSAQSDCVSYCESQQGYARSLFCSSYPYRSEEKGIIATNAGYKWNDTLTFINISPKAADAIEAELLGYLEGYSEQPYVRDVSFIKSNLTHYNRQFFSFMDKAGDPIVMINFFWMDKEYRNFDFKQPIFVDDGGHFFWKVQYNLKTKKFFDLKVNGKA
jgi:hypothetical protein